MLILTKKQWKKRGMVIVDEDNIVSVTKKGKPLYAEDNIYAKPVLTFNEFSGRYA